MPNPQAPFSGLQFPVPIPNPHSIPEVAAAAGCKLQLKVARAAAPTLDRQLSRVQHSKQIKLHFVNIDKLKSMLAQVNKYFLNTIFIFYFSPKIWENREIFSKNAK